MAKVSAPSWKRADYSPLFLIDKPRHTLKEIRAEYTKMRDIGMKRANRLEKAGLSEEAAYLRKSLPKIKEMKSTEEVRSRISQAYSVIHGRQSKELTLKGAKEIEANVVSKLFENKITKKEALDFNRFMQSWRTSIFGVGITSDKAKELYEQYTDTEKGGSFDRFYRLYRIQNT